MYQDGSFFVGVSFGSLQIDLRHGSSQDPNDTHFFVVKRIAFNDEFISRVLDGFFYLPPLFAGNVDEINSQVLAEVAISCQIYLGFTYKCRIQCNLGME